MSFPKARRSIDEELAEEGESHDLIPSTQTDHGNSPSLFQRLLTYPTPNSLKLKSTSWLDGVRGTAALGVYIFHTMGCWAFLVPAWHADKAQTNILQFPFLRTFFVSGGAAVSVFFVLSGYVLTHKSLSWMRSGRRAEVSPAVASSLFRRGFRLYLPPIFVTFFEMISTRFGYAPPLNFEFKPEATLSAQFLDWLEETNHLVNPVHNWKRAMQGYIMHPKYDAVIWTIPLEFYGSLVCYALLFLLARVPGNKIRMICVAIFAIFSMAMGSWNLFCFSSGMLLADFNLSQEMNDTLALPKPPQHQKLWLFLFTAAFYVAGFPSLGYGSDGASKPMPGFETLFALTPLSLQLEEPGRFMWSLAGVSLLLSISQVPKLKKVFETDFCQYIGRISFSLYLIHEFCLVLFGLAFQSFLMRIAGLTGENGAEGPARAEGGVMYWVVCGVWFLWFTVTVFGISAQVERWVDVPSVNFARWLEAKCLKFYKGFDKDQ